MAQSSATRKRKLRAKKQARNGQGGNPGKARSAGASQSAIISGAEEWEVNELLFIGAGEFPAPMHLVLVHDALARGADVNAVGADGRTALHLASDHLITAVLLDHGADPCAKDKFGHEALHYARSADQIEVLVAAGADVNARGALGRTPLFYARNVKIVEALLDAGAELHAVADDGEHADEAVMQCSAYGATEEDRIAAEAAAGMLQALRQRDALRGDTPLPAGGRRRGPL